MAKQKILIIGGGFAGIKAAETLCHSAQDFEIVLISDRTCFEYHAALYRTATGRSLLEVMVPLEEIFKGKPVTVIQDSVTEIDAENQQVQTITGGCHTYDKLILAVGSVTEYYGIKGLPDFSYNIKTAEGAARFRQHLHSEFTGSEPLDHHYVIVGGGPTGIELAGELVSYLQHLQDKYGLDRKFHVQLVEAAPRLLPALPEHVAAKIQSRLEEIGVKVITSTAVKAETADKLKLPQGDIKTHTVVWTAGVSNNPLVTANAKLFKLGKGGRAEVDGELIGAKNIYVLGDSASTERTGWAQTALYDGNFVATNLIRALSKQKPLPYKAPKPIAAIPVGPKWCAVSSDRGHFYGYAGWIIRRYLDLKLFMQLLPRDIAWNTWLNARKSAEIEDSPK